MMATLRNHKHELFAQALAKGENATAAYKAAGYSARGNAAEASASRLLRDAKVQGRLIELQERAAVKVELTIADIIEQLQDDRQLAHNIEQAGSAVSASLGMAKVLGFLKDKVEHSGPDGGPIEHHNAAKAEIEDLFGPTPHEIIVEAKPE
jgi:hypothetical protein